MIIQKSKCSSLKEFETFWRAALTYQKERNLPLWSPFPEATISDEINESRHFSGCVSGNTLAGFFSITFSDPMIWGEAERGDAIYVHRMCVNPALRGDHFAGQVLAWACGYAVGMERKFVRMDTWAANQRLVDYYVKCGFKLIGCKTLRDVSGLLPHYRGQELALFENEV
jgi:predicted GNAT family N-acyltransferase